MVVEVVVVFCKVIHGFWLFVFDDFGLVLVLRQLVE